MTPDQTIDARKKAYAKIFDSPDGEIVLTDLAKFCRANESTFHEDPRLSDVLIGRREVFLRVQQHLNLSNQELWERFK